MSRSMVIAALALVAAAVGCQSDQQMLDNKQPQAVQMAVDRGKFELGCQTATGVVISREMIQPALQGPFVNGIPRAEYTVGVEGCNERKTYVVICPEGGGEGCFAAGPGPFHNY